MIEAEVRSDVERELRRVVDRLTSMPLARAATAADACYAAAEVLLAQTRPLDPAIPTTATLPKLGPQGLGAMIAVLGDDYLAAASSSDADGADVVLAALVTLRRALP